MYCQLLVTGEINGYFVLLIDRLAERNCHEIVDKLISLGLIEVIYTSDGKSYLTPQELEKEILEEVMVHGGKTRV